MTELGFAAEAAEEVKALIREGRFRKALETLTLHAVNQRGHLACEVLRAELLERTGRHSASRDVLQKLERSKGLSPAQQSTCALILSRLEKDAGNLDSSRTSLQRAISRALTAQDLECLCVAQLPLALLLADECGPEAATTLLEEIRSAATKLGSPHVSAALHLTVGELDAKRGLMTTARRHTQLAQQILKGSPNLLLEMWTENNLLAISIVNADFEDALIHGHRALQLAEESGLAQTSALTNLGNVFYATGEFDQAIAYFEKAIAFLPSAGEKGNAMLESVARVRLAQGAIEVCAELLDQIEETIQPSHRRLYVYRHAQLTRTRLLLRKGLINEALESAECVLELARTASDHLLLAIGLIAKAEVLQRLGRPSESLATLDGLVLSLPNYPPDIQARYQGVLACALRVVGNVSAGQSYLDRAVGIFGSLRSNAEIQELNRAWAQAYSPAENLRVVDRSRECTSGANNLLQNVATLMMHAGRPELLATGIVAILADTGAVLRAEALSRGDDGSVETLAVHEQPSETGERSAEPARTLAIGSARNRSVEVLLRPRADIESTATLNALTLLLGTVRDLERAHAEREEQLALWPIEELPLDGEQAVIGGCLHELLSFARRIARTNVSVLITGESGTGKEILARAIHGYSSRADKPFVPFNCTAVPRELLESQLFGYRRGAFTGAERDSPGLIRAAKGGTLFLDEIGELSIDLQPKLLRFLESGEISPLGESPLTVDVRIVAATNRNLEQLVQEERFREDLYYRLNVIRLTIPPLRERRDEITALVHHFLQRAATEFSKGRVRIAEETMAHLLLYPWPGNIRQLHNEIRRMVALAESDVVLKPSALSPEIRRAAKALPKSTGQELAVSLTDKLTPTLSRIEREMIRAALRSHQGRVEPAAKALGISRKGLYLKRLRLGL